MTEEEKNIEYICKETGLDKDYFLIPIILKMLSNAYIDGLKQGHLDKDMDISNIIDKIKEYVHQEIVSYTETIEDYIEDDKDGNSHYIGELKEIREHWKDIERIMNRDNHLYMDWWKYGLYE